MKTNTMKKYLLLIVLLSVCIFNAEAQNKNRNRIKTLKVSFISNAIELTSKEAEKFWPIYNLYDSEIKQLKSQLERDNFNNLDAIDSMSDKKANELIYHILNTENKIATLRKQLVEKLTSVISSKKILKLQKAERDFNRRMLHEFGKRRRMNGQNGQRQ